MSKQGEKTMGALVPAITRTVGLINTVNSAFNAVNNLRGNIADVTGGDERRRALIAQQDLALKQLQDRQRLEEQQGAEEAALARERLAAEAQQAEEKRRAALRRAVARQRADFAGQGLSAEGGSAEAVLLGLFDESEDELERREALDNLRNKALDLDTSQTRSVNVLQATQLAERNNLKRLFV